jgi:hypothetical protein
MDKAGSMAMVSRLSLLDDETRPSAPRINGVTDAQRSAGRRLAFIHKLHLQEMAEVRLLMMRVIAGQEAAEKLKEAVSSMQMAANYRQFGNLCGRQCHALAFHHSMEDDEIFPALPQYGGLAQVVERLRAEHLVIHDLLQKTESAAADAVHDPGPGTFERLREAYEMLERVVISHFGYEQNELEEAIGYYGIRL